MIICFLAPKIDATSKVDLSKFVPKNVNKLTEEEVVDELVESILYNKGEDLCSMWLKNLFQSYYTS